MKQNMNNMTRRTGHMLCTARKTLERMLSMCMVRTDSPSQRAVVAACGPMPLWSRGWACADVSQKRRGFV